MDELRGDRADWRFDGETVRIRYRTGAFKNAMLKELGRITVPVSAVSEVDFDLFESKRKRWALQLRMREGADPYAAVGAMLDQGAQPFRLLGPASTELVAEYAADQIRFAAERAAASDPTAQIATRLVPPLPLHIQTGEGTASFDGSAVRLIWTGSEASSRKKKAHRREIALADVTGVEWVPSDGWEYGHMRVTTTEAVRTEITKPKHDLSCLLCDEGKEGAAALMMAATITAHLWARDQRAAG
ncbi:DUF4429 domain-containing protein [Streptomonospora sp. PA3]|uniref:DUF4429 domain-containing protein n=1 Tax=Streptomonospora sp. PA3 TaxID=2607326 RepID=UPI0012DC20C5|nr:DUF4429 domain-containing protein [Streptomonospora sp. PA3]MUL42042.1 DUF4429 domain-containing protein [Streptomonospora sp. PA3]